MFYTTSNPTPEATTNSSSNQIGLVSVITALFKIIGLLFGGVLTIIRFVFTLISTGFMAFVGAMEQFGNPSQNRPH